MKTTEIELIECPRDAMQGLPDFIPTDLKIAYINQLLQAGFHTLDFGSFVSPKAIPQMADTAEVLAGLDLKNTTTKLLAIVANTRGAEDACKYSEINYLGFPFSISETFQQRNTNSSISESLGRVKEITELCTVHNKELVIYISMAFGNPYGDEWNPQIAIDWSKALYEETGTKIIALSDTIGIADRKSISDLFTHLIPALPEVNFGAHLHTTPTTWKEKMEAAWSSGCKRFDGAIKGYGGCPMAKDDLTGNMPMEHIIDFMKKKNVSTGIDEAAFAKAFQFSDIIFH